MLPTRERILDIMYGLGKVEYPYLKKPFYKWVINFTIQSLKRPIPYDKDGMPTAETAEIRRMNDYLTSVQEGTHLS